MQPIVSIIILNENNRKNTLTCLRSLDHLTTPHVRVLVVDNGSEDGSSETIETQFPQVELIAGGESLGFTVANNAGIRQALDSGTDYILLLNNDTIVAPDLVDVLVGAMNADPSIGVAGPIVYYHSQPDLIWSAGGAIDWKRGTTTMIGTGEDDKGQFGLVTREVDFVTGSALMARREVWEKAGLFDDQFYMYYEEVEWCLRARRAGFRIAQVPQAMVWRKLPTDDYATSPRAFYYMTRNRLLFLRHSQASLRVWLYTLGEYARTLASWSLRPKWRGQRHLRGAMLRAIKDFSSGNFGQMPV